MAGVNADAPRVKAGLDASPEEDVVIVARDIRKAYGGVEALKGVTFRARRGAVNVLVGENGAGKSTLMKILSGSEKPTSGDITLDGACVVLASPRAAMSAGIGIIHQELSLFPNLSIAENMFAGHELHHVTSVDFAEQRRRTAAMLKRLGQSMSPDTKVADLPIGQQQLVEIGRVLLTDARVLIMDEPTSALSNTEVDVLFSAMAELRGDGVTVIYISHKLDEFRRIGDWVSVLRDGRLVAEASMRETDTAWIVRQMVGRDPSTLFAKNSRDAAETVLEVKDLTVAGSRQPVVNKVSLTVRAGEVVGIYGLMGAGRTELLEAILAMRSTETGTVSVNGEVLTRATVAAHIDAGLALVPEDRQRDGLVQTMSVKDNLILSTLGRLSRRGTLLPGREKRAAGEQVSRLSIKSPGLSASIGALSGGNQQKVVLGRALLTNPLVLLLDEPSRGVDVGAKSQIASIIAELADQGMAILFASSELAEVTAMADRVIVMARGRVTATLTAEEITEEALVAASASAEVLQDASREESA